MFITEDVCMNITRCPGGIDLAKSLSICDGLYTGRHGGDGSKILYDLLRGQRYDWHREQVSPRVPGDGIAKTGRVDPTENLIGKDCMIYIDDCLVYSGGTLQDRLKRLERTIVRLSSFGLRGKSPKIVLAMNELKFLGHIIGKDGRRLCPEKM